MAKAPTFEEALKTLEETVARLEQGQLPLNEALTCFESGVKSAARCRELLGEVTTRVDVLIKEAGGTLRTAPFAGIDDEDDAEDED
jgi:exodeoxyribonuclease VII small subunit